MAISRRSFLKSSAAATALSITGSVAGSVLAQAQVKPLAPGPGNKWPGRVVVNFNKSAVPKETKIDDTDPESIGVIKKMVDDSIKALAGKSTVGEAWKAIFPDTLTKNSKIAIKTNFYTTSQCRVPWPVVQAMTEGLQQMDFDGAKFPAANITIFEGNIPAQNNFKGAGYTPERFPGINMVIDTFDKNVTDAANGENDGYAKSLKAADFFMNVFGLRGHDTGYAEGVTLGGKSHYGTYSNARMIHSNPATSVRIAHMMASGVVYNKLVLSVSAGLLSNKKGSGINDGPGDYSRYTKKIDPTSNTKATNTIVMSTDPVSTEMQAVKVMQINADKTFAVSDMPKYLQAIGGVSGALSNVSYNIGIIDEKEMDVISIINDDNTTQIRGGTKRSSGSNNYRLHVSPLDRQGFVRIEYTVPSAGLGDRAAVSIYDLLGNLIYSKELSIDGALNFFAWDRKSSLGKTAGRGKYICKLTVGGISRAAAFSLL